MDTLQEIIRIATGKLQLATIKSTIKNFDAEPAQCKEDNPDWPEGSATLLPSGSLRIMLSRAFTIEIEEWKKGFSVWQITKESKQQLHKDVQLQPLDFGTVVDNSPDYRMFINTIPHHIREAVKPFKMNQLSMLQWIAKDEQAEDLVKHNPLLLWLIIETDQYQPQSKNILSYKQHEILRWLSYPPNKSSIRWLKSLQKDAWDVYTLKNVMSCLGSEQVIVRLRKLPNGTPAIGTVLATYPELLDTRISEHMDHSLDDDQLLKEFQHTSMYFRDTLRLSQLLNIPNILNRIRQCQSIESLKAIHDQLSKEFTYTHNHFKKNEVFPNGPLKDDESVQQIRSTYDLFEEGKTMHHCVASYAYASEAKKGNHFYYRILAPERLTMEIKINDTVILVLQCKGACNKKPNKESIVFITKWLLDNGGMRKVTFARDF